MDVGLSIERVNVREPNERERLDRERWHPRYRCPWSSYLGLVAYVAMFACCSTEAIRPTLGGGTRLIRIVPDASIPVDSYGVTGPAVNAD